MLALAFRSFSSCPGDGGLVEIITPDGDVAVQLVGIIQLGAPSPARIGKWIGGLGLRISLGSALSDVPSGGGPPDPPP